MNSLALKYRPSGFQDLIGQLHAARSLQNAINHQRIAQAYLFFGSRGVGKTSTARILAKCLNCLNNGVSTQPCGKCENCREISEGKNMDVIEMDGASNRGIEHIRDLRENVRFSPMRSKYKIYIIDEVHMLTNEAFNALLKTLEEPPEHVVFIMATTEYHKIPETILSRCQTFAFKKFNNLEIVNRLKSILASEQIAYQEDALIPVAIKAEGSMRDAISILDQLISFSGGDTIDKNMAVEVLGIIPFDQYISFLQNIKNRDLKNCLLVLETMYHEGYNLKNFLRYFLEFLKNTMLLKHGLIQSNDFIMSDKEVSTLKEQLLSWDHSELVLLFDKFYKLFSNWSFFQTTNSSEILITLEIAIVDIFQKLDLPSISTLMQKVANLNSSIQNGTPFIDTSVKKEEKNTAKEINHAKSATESNKKTVDIDPLDYIQKEFGGSEEENGSNPGIFK